MRHESESRPTAHDRFKRRSSATWPIGFMLAVTIHFATFQLFPRTEIVTAAEVRRPDLEAVEIPPPPTVEVPPPPRVVARPAVPRVAPVRLSENVTIVPPTFEQNPAPELGPPPPDATANPGDRPRYIPYTVAPRLENPKEVLAALKREYPTTLRQAEVSGRVELWLYISEEGKVVETRIAESSGYPQFDEAAQRVAREMHFSPGRNRDRVTPVWLTQPIRFSTS